MKESIGKHRKISLSNNWLPILRKDRVQHKKKVNLKNIHSIRKRLIENIIFRDSEQKNVFWQFQVKNACSSFDSKTGLL